MAENSTRDTVISFRVTAAEASHLEAAGAALANPRRRNDFARGAALIAARQRVPAPCKPIRAPARRKATADVVALTRVLAAIGKLGSNVNQLARAANKLGNLPTEAALRDIAAEVLVTRNLVTSALSSEAPDGH